MKKHRMVVVNDKMQSNYRYNLTEQAGKKFDTEFNPELSPKQMLELGVFGGKYMTDCRNEFPASWYEKAKLSPSFKNIDLNYFKIDASMPISEWQRRGWIHPEDPRGWFQWYCRYYMGRRIPEEDKRQITRWKQMKRHVAQVRINCLPGDTNCRRKQRQALLHWAYDSRKI